MKATKVKVEPKTKLSSAELARMTKSRQLFALNNLTSSLVFNNNITYWEQLTCAGYNPQDKRLEAVVNIKQTSGYNGGLCSNGSREYVRFFVDFQDGAGFQDMGYTSFKVADISNSPPGPQHPISYMAYMFIDDSKYKRFRDCDHAVLPKIRAVLSWNTIPSTDPEQIPFYGNRLDADIQLERKRWFPWFEFTELTKLEGLKDLVNPDFQIMLKEPQVVSTEDIIKLNKAAGVPDHRTFYSAIGSKINSDVDFSKAASVLAIENIDKLGIDINKFLDLSNFFGLDEKEADVTFEQLTCLGLNTERDSLGAVVNIKKSAGFNGNMCTSGSMEHVAFWADWNNNGIFDQYLGTVSFNAHDIENIPDGGLYYNVLLPFDVSAHLRSCDSPNIIRIRAVLSWESLPSTTNPDALNTWGNFKDALVQLRPALGQGPGLHAKIYAVGSVDRDMISPSEYLYNYKPGAATRDNNRPWGGDISFNGIIDRNGDGGVIKYSILYKKFGDSDSTFQPVSISETFRLDDLNTPAPWFYDTQTSVTDGWFEYKQNPGAGLYNIDNYFASWNAGSLDDGTYTIRFVTRDSSGTEVIADQFSIIVYNKGMTVSPTANTNVDPGFDLDLVIDGGDCHSYTAQDPMIDGHLKAVHPYFADWSLDLQPTSHTHGAVPSPTSGSYSAFGDTGDANRGWTLDTTLLDPCGYTVSIGARTRVILNSQADFPPYGPKAVGFAKLP